MNRRSFLKNSALALFGFTVLPPAETYQRIWKARKKIPGYVFNPADYQGEWIINEAYRTAEYEEYFIMSPEFLESCRIKLLEYDPPHISGWRYGDGVWRLTPSELKPKS